MKNDKAVNKFN